MLADPIRVLTRAKVDNSMGLRPNCAPRLSHAAGFIHKRAARLRGCHGCSCEVALEQMKTKPTEKQGEPSRPADEF